MEQRSLFGTDGIRGVANEPPMTAELALQLGRAVAHHFEGTRAGRDGSEHRTRILIGKDTRLSGYMFETALCAGITSMGADVQLVGPLPTPGISSLTTGMRADAGIVISASHNPFRDNGIKLFGPDGFKLPDEQEAAIEATVHAGDEPELPDAEEIGKVSRIDDAAGRYIVFLKNTFPEDLTLEGVDIVIDCANGAGYRVGPAVLEELGADVTTLGADPDGTNINRDCGSTAPEKTTERVRATGADIGISLDGDADRVILVDERGEIVDGDKILGLCALHLAENDGLAHDTLVATVMSNLGLDLALRDHGIDVVRTRVGDRYVVERMREEGYNLGGEQSGHLIFLDHTTTGDGLIAALQVLAIMQRRGKPLSELARVVEPLPQTLVNVDVTRKPPLEQLE
ncbi:MAG: phosphoglucosamine mutase, partial [Bradymonadaceae bacterium]